MTWGWKYKTGEQVQHGDRLKISKKYAERFGVSQNATVVGLQGFVTVRLSNGENLDLDMRSIICLVGRKDA